MSSIDLDRRLQRWLAEEAPNRAPARVVQEARSRVAETPQRRYRAAWLPAPARRYPWLPLATAAAVVLILGFSWLGTRNPNGIGGPQSPAPTATNSPYSCPSGKGACLGPLSPGTYHSSEFDPRFAVDVPEGWTNTLDVPGQYDLSYDAGSSYRYPDGTSFHDGISIFRKPIAESSAKDEAEAGVGQNASALATWLSEHVDVVASQPVAVTVNGADGFRVTVAPRAGPRAKPDHCTTDHGLDQCESLFRGGDPTYSFGFGIVGPESVVVYLLDLPSGETVMVVIDDVDGINATGLTEAATPIVNSIVFGQ
jgi:hypothetical protein